MTQLKVTEQPTQWTCAECGSPVVLRTESFSAWGNPDVVRDRRHVCQKNQAHVIGELVARAPQA